MTLKHIKKEIAELKDKIKPKDTGFLFVKYDPKVGKPDRSTLPEASVYLFLPNKDQYSN